MDEPVVFGADIVLDGRYVPELSQRRGAEGDREGRHPDVEAVRASCRSGVHLQLWRRRALAMQVPCPRRDGRDAKSKRPELRGGRERMMQKRTVPLPGAET